MQRKTPYSQAEKAVLQCANPATKLDIGAHSANLLAELEGLIIAQIPISQIILCATLVDSLQHEETEFSQDSAYYDDAGDGLAWLNRAEREALGWLRARRNQLVHFEGLAEGMTGQYHTVDKARLTADADRALKAILPLLEEREIVG